MDIPAERPARPAPMIMRWIDILSVSVDVDCQTQGVSKNSKGNISLETFVSSTANSGSRLPDADSDNPRPMSF